MHDRYEVTYMVMGTMHIYRRCETFTEARKAARTCAADLRSTFPVNHHVFVHDTRNDGAEVWRERVDIEAGAPPPTDIVCHSPTHKGDH